MSAEISAPSTLTAGKLLLGEWAHVDLEVCGDEDACAPGRMSIGDGRRPEQLSHDQSPSGTPVSPTHSG